MRVLFLAPHPFYQERGTPIAVDLLLRVLSERGDRVDVLTFPEGEDRTYPGVTIRRIARPPGAHNIRPGFSAKKVLCDLWMLREAGRMARETTYDLVHAVEESVFIAMHLCRRRGTPFVFDMDSSMPVQIVDKRPAWKILLPIMARCERAAIRRATAVVAVCDELAELAKRGGASRIFTLRDVSLLSAESSSSGSDLRSDLNIRGLSFLYLGNLESYQGIDLLLESFALFRQKNTAESTLVIAGGNPDHIARYTERAKTLGIESAVRFPGPQPLDRMASLFRSVDVLVSPRTQGGNTPMKIFSYLDSGRAVLATRLPTHTQVLDEEVALLAAPAPGAFADAMHQLAADPSLLHRLGEAGRDRARTMYSWDVFRNTARAMYAELETLLAGETPSR